MNGGLILIGTDCALVDGHIFKIIIMLNYEEEELNRLAVRSYLNKIKF